MASAADRPQKPDKENVVNVCGTVGRGKVMAMYPELSSHYHFDMMVAVSA